MQLDKKQLETKVRSCMKNRKAVKQADKEVNSNTLVLDMDTYQETCNNPIPANEALGLRAMVDFINDYRSGDLPDHLAKYTDIINSARIHGNQVGFATKENLVARFEHWRANTTASNKDVLLALELELYQKARERAFKESAEQQAEWELNNPNSTNQD